MSERILFVDDNVETQRLVQLVLEREGYQVIQALGGEEALAVTRQEQPDLILMDIMMPGMDGLETIRRLRAMPGTADTPIIIFTARSGLEDELEGFEAGADAFLTKLTSPSELAVRVKAALSRSKRRARGRVLGVLAAKGGLGVSTVALNLGVTIHRTTNQDTIVADFRPGQGTLSLILGHQRPDGLSRLLQKDTADLSAGDVQGELVRDGSGVLLLLSSADPPDAEQITSVNQFETIARYLGALAPYTVLDLGPGLPPVTSRLLGLLTEIILVVEPIPQTIAQSKLLIEALDSRVLGQSQLHVILVNRGGSSVQLTWSQVEEQLGQAPALAFTPAAELAYRAADQNQPIVMVQPGSPTARQFLQLAEMITH